MYDLIGDIHGYATELKALLTKMNYREIDGVWQHPKRTVIFLGDFVDKGPEQLEVIRIAKAMVEKGKAMAVMGNHEFNAVLWATKDTKNPGGDSHLRAHSSKNLDQHREFLEQVGEDTDLHSKVIDWFKTLPLYLNMEEFRVVHACWHPDYLQVIDRHTDDQNCIKAESWTESAKKGSELFDAVEILLKGLEVKLPNGFQFLDQYGHSRSKIRTQWWRSGDDLTCKDVALAPVSIIKQLPHEKIGANVLPGYDCLKPVFVGHYWMSGTPALLTEHVACLDYSVAGDRNGKLCAYRWDGEERLDEDKFCHVNRVTA